MRIIVTGDRNWYAPDLAEQVINRLILRYGPSLVIVHGAATGIDRSFFGGVWRPRHGAGDSPGPLGGARRPAGGHPLRQAKSAVQRQCRVNKPLPTLLNCCLA